MAAEDATITVFLTLKASLPAAIWPANLPAWSARLSVTCSGLPDALLTMSSKKLRVLRGPTLWVSDKMVQTITLDSQMADVQPATRLLSGETRREQMRPTLTTLVAMWSDMTISSSLGGKASSRLHLMALMKSTLS